MSRITLLGTYGSLRVGEYNHSSVKDSMPIVELERKVAGYKMYSLGAYPAIVRTDDPEDIITIDVFDMASTQQASNMMSSIHRMETNAGYDIEVASTIDGEMEVLLYTQTYRAESFDELGHEQVVGGDWTAYQRQRQHGGT